MHQQVQHSESSTLHTLTPPDELIKGLVKAVKVAPNEKCENFPRKIGALQDTHAAGCTATMCRGREGVCVVHLRVGWLGVMQFGV